MKPHKHFLRVHGRVLVPRMGGFNIMRCEDPTCAQTYLVRLGYFTKTEKPKNLGEWISHFMKEILG